MQLYQSLKDMWSFVKSNDKKTQIEFNDEFKELNNSIKRTIINSPALLIFFLTCLGAVFSFLLRAYVGFIFKDEPSVLDLFYSLVSDKMQYDLVLIGLCIFLILAFFSLYKLRSQIFWERNSLGDQQSSNTKEKECGSNERTCLNFEKILLKIQSRWKQLIDEFRIMGWKLFRKKVWKLLPKIIKTIVFLSIYVFSFSYFCLFLLRLINFHTAENLVWLLLTFINVVGSLAFYFSSFKCTDLWPLFKKESSFALVTIFQLKRGIFANVVMVVVVVVSVIVLIITWVSFKYVSDFFLLNEKEFFQTICLILFLFYFSWMLVLFLYDPAKPYYPQNESSKDILKKKGKIDARTPKMWIFRDFLILSVGIVFFIHLYCLSFIQSDSSRFYNEFVKSALYIAELESLSWLQC